MTLAYVTEEFTSDERSVLARHFTNLEGPVFALVDLPEAVKGAMFARYSRTTKSLRRLFLDEFAGDVDEIAGAHAGPTSTAGSERAARLYDSVFVEYGDDSVAQLGGVHLACEQASQLLAKELEWGRLAAYLEQSTRYMRYDDRPGGAWRATVPPELQGTPAGERYERFLDDAFTAYGRMYEPMEAWFRDRYPKQPHDSDFVYRQTIMAKTCDTLRVLLPAGTRSNLGIYATGQSYEQLLMRLAVHPLAEMREYGELMKAELRKVIPEFLKRVDVEERGVAWSRYWQRNRERTQDLTDRVLSEAGAKPEHRDEVTLVDFDPEGETKVAAAVLYASSAMPDITTDPPTSTSWSSTSGVEPEVSWTARIRRPFTCRRLSGSTFSEATELSSTRSMWPWVVTCQITAAAMPSMTMRTRNWASVRVVLCSFGGCVTPISRSTPRGGASARVPQG